MATDESTPEDGGTRPRLVLGLGNPGERYRATRHNLGFRVVEELGRRRGIALARLECNALVGAGGDGEGAGVTLALPQTYMNRSGYAARCLAERHGFAPRDVLVVYDEVALPVGRLRLRPGGSPGGHRGMESVVENLRTDEVPRLRVGCAGEAGTPAGEELVEYVLAPFPPDELERVEEMIERAAEACASWLDRGLEATMSTYNREPRIKS